MKPPRSDPQPDFDLIATFGGAQLVKDLAGRLTIRGGTPEDQAAAHAWAAQFLDAPLHEPPSLRYSIMPRSSQPSAINHQPLPPPPRPQRTPPEQLRQYLINNPPAESAPWPPTVDARRTETFSRQPHPHPAAPNFPLPPAAPAGASSPRTNMANGTTHSPSQHRGLPASPACFAVTTRRLAIMNLAICGMEADIGKEHADTFRHAEHPDLRADTATRARAKTKPRGHMAGILRSERQLLANRSFSNSDTALRGSKRHDCEANLQIVRGAKDSWSKDDDVRWQFGVQPKGNAKFPCCSIRHSTIGLRHSLRLVPQGMAGLVPANGSMSSNHSGDCNARSARREGATNSQGLGSQRDIRRALIEADLVVCMVALPGKLFYSAQIPVRLCFLVENKAADAKRGFRDRRKQTLFIDARELRNGSARNNRTTRQPSTRQTHARFLVCPRHNESTLTKAPVTK